MPWRARTLETVWAGTFSSAEITSRPRRSRVRSSTIEASTCSLVRQPSAHSAVLVLASSPQSMRSCLSQR